MIQRTAVHELLATLLGMASVAGCQRAPQNVFRSAGACGAAIHVVAASGPRLTLEIANTSSETIRIGTSSAASFVDAQGNAMSAQLRAEPDEWFMSFALPPHSHRRVTVTLTGDATAIDRVEIPNSGSGVIPLCTIQIGGLAAAPR